MNLADEPVAMLSVQGDLPQGGEAVVSRSTSANVPRHFSHPSDAPFRADALSALLVLAALGTSAIVHSITGTNYLFPLLFAVIFASWYGGLRPGLVALSLSVFAAVLLLFGPFYSSGANSNDMVSLAVFGGLATSIMLLASRGRALLKANGRTEEQARESLHVAERAIQQLRQVQTITDVALNHLDIDSLLHELLTRLRDHLHADTASVFLLDDDGIMLAERSSSGLREELGEHPRIRIGDGFAGQVAASREPAIVDDLSKVPVVSALVRERMHSALGVPILTQDRLVGVLTAASVRERNFTFDELGLTELVADRVAVAIDHAQLFRAAQEATAELALANAVKDEAVNHHRTMEEELTLLVDASGALIESLDPDEMLPKILRLASKMVDADAYALWRLDEEQRTWTVASAEGLSARYLASQTRILIAENTPRMPQSVIAKDVSSEPMLSDRGEGYREEGIRSIMALPLRIGGQATGSVTFYYRTPHEFSEEEIRVASALANLSSSALALSRLHEDESAARERMEEANRKLAFLARASDTLSESLEYETTLQKVAQLAVPLLADWCIVTIAEGDEQPRTIAVAHRDPDLVKMVRKMGERYPAEPDPDAEHGWPQVQRTRQPDLWDEVPIGVIEKAAGDEEHLGLLRQLGIRSSLVVPLIAREHLIGAITLVTADLHPPLTQSDVPLAAELARRASVAIDNAQLFREAQRVAGDLREANAAKDEFLSLVSHELRTPITVILGDSHVLVNRADLIDDETRLEAIRDINSEAERLNRIIENLLVLARVEHGAANETEPVLLGRLLQRIIDAHINHAPWRSISLRSEDPSILVNSSEFCIEQTARNFLSNAEKYSPSQSLIEVVVSRVGDQGEIRVLDRGTGIAPDETERLFQAFYRSESTADVSGVGIGLAVCKRLVEAHGGRVWARPRDGGGAEFAFSLPAVEHSEEPPGEAPAREPAMSGSAD